MNAPILRKPGLVAVVLTSATAFASLPAFDVPLPGSKMQLIDSSGPAGRRNFVALRDGTQAAPPTNPTITGATVSIGRVGASEVTVLDLPPSGWSGGPQDFKFKSQSGPVIAARLLGGHSIRLSARGDGVYALGGTPQGGVGIIIDVGGVRFCGFFGGTIVKDDGHRFRARKAPAPAACPILGTTTTTSTTTSTLGGMSITAFCNCVWADADSLLCGSTTAFFVIDGCLQGCPPETDDEMCNNLCLASGVVPDTCVPETATYITPSTACTSAGACSPPPCAPGTSCAASE